MLPRWFFCRAAPLTLVVKDVSKKEKVEHKDKARQGTRMNGRRRDKKKHTNENESWGRGKAHKTENKIPETEVNKENISSCR